MYLFIFYDIFVIFRVMRAEADRCCSTAAAGWCCHTGSHTKRPSQTSSSTSLLPVSSWGSGSSGSRQPAPSSFPRPSSSRPHAVTPSCLPHGRKHSRTPLHLLHFSPLLPLRLHRPRQASV